MAAETFTGKGKETIQAAFEKKDYYEAHQIFKSLNFRYLRQKKFKELIDLLFDGITQFFKLGVNQSGIDLAKMFVEVLEKGDIAVSPDVISQIESIVRSIPADLKNERATFLHSIMNWSAKRNPDTSAGHAAIHKAVARLLLEEGSLESAVYHSVRALDVTGCLEALTRISQQQPDTVCKNELVGDQENYGSHDLDQRSLGMAVLEFLTLKRLDLARELFVRFVADHKNPEVKSKCYNFKILALMSALLSLCSRSNISDGSEEEFHKIEAAITNIYSDNQRVEKILTKIGLFYLGIKPANQGPFGGLLSNIFKKDTSVLESAGSTTTDKDVTEINQDMDLD